MRHLNLFLKNQHKLVRTILFTGFALIAFAANSVLCRLALEKNTIDASGFVILRLLSGALVLYIILMFTHRKSNKTGKGNWPASFMLFLYAVTFSFAYITLDTATGALILFGSVQSTMIILSLLSGDRLYITEWTGVTIAFFGFLYLILPSVTTPSVIGFILMSVAGMAWGIYTLIGKKSRSPLSDTAFNFIRSVPFVVILAVITFQNTHFSLSGILLAIASGGLASGIGYAIWYTAIGELSAVQAAVVQLFVPVIAAFGGVFFISEIITLRLVLSALMILGGILLVMVGRHYFINLKVNK